MQVPTTKMLMVCNSIIINMSDATYSKKNYETVIWKTTDFPFLHSRKALWEQDHDVFSWECNEAD